MKKNLMSVPEEVMENVKRYLEKENLGELVDVMRASEHPDDWYLYHVIAKKGNVYSCWTAWNEITQSLDYGHYNLVSEDVAREICAEFFNSLS